MRNKIIKLLRKLEQENSYESKYIDYVEQYNSEYDVVENLDFPNYKYIINQFNDKHSTKDKNGVIILTAENSIKAELKRMEIDGLISINIQEGIRNAYTKGEGPDSDYNDTFNTESIILTTIGKSKFKYYWHELTKNPFTIIIAITSLIISIVALTK